MVLQKNNARLKAYNKTLKRVISFRRRLGALRMQLRALYKKREADPDSVTVSDWDDIARGSERKVLYLYGKFDRDHWHEGVPYPNLIARHKAQMAENTRLKKENAELREENARWKGNSS